jgi:hypothetical protein
VAIGVLERRRDLQRYPGFVRVLVDNLIEFVVRVASAGIWIGATTSPVSLGGCCPQVTSWMRASRTAATSSAK